MRAIYSLAAELGKPVLMHFQKLTADFNSGFTRFPAILKTFPNTTFLGNENYFRANVSANEPTGVSYPGGKVKPGVLTDRMPAGFPNLDGDLSAHLGRNSLAPHPDHAARFLERHRRKLLFRSDRPCPIGRTECTARTTLTHFETLASPEVFAKIAFGNTTKSLKL